MTQETITPLIPPRLTKAQARKLREGKQVTLALTGENVWAMEVSKRFIAVMPKGSLKPYIDLIIVNATPSKSAEGTFTVTAAPATSTENKRSH